MLRIASCSCSLTLFISMSAAYCPSPLGRAPSNWRGEVVLERPGIEYTGVCLGLHKVAGVFDTPKTCDKVGVRLHHLHTNSSDGTGYYWMKMDIRIKAGSFAFNPVFFNATFVQDVQTILGDENDAFTYLNQDFGDWRFFSLNTSANQQDNTNLISTITTAVNNFVLPLTSASPSDQIFTARVGYPIMPHGSYSLCMTDLKCGDMEDVMYEELVSKDGNVTEYDPATHVHMYKAKVKHRCSPGSVMGGNISEFDSLCTWSRERQMVNK